MARPVSRRRKRKRPLSRAQRYALAPKPPAAVILTYSVALGRLGDKWAGKVRAALKGKLDEFATERRADANEESSDAALDSVSFSTNEVLRTSHGIPEKATRHSKAEFKRIGIRFSEKDEPPLAKVTADWRAASAARVQRILARERDTITELLRDSENRTPEELTDRLEERFVVTKSKLETAATDDVLTLNGQISQERQTAAGITQFVWTTAGDERTRDSHAEIDGKTFDWDDPPDVDGEQVIPGEPPNCRCVAYAILDELADAPEQESLAAE